MERIVSSTNGFGATVQSHGKNEFGPLTHTIYKQLTKIESHYRKLCKNYINYIKL